MINSLKKTMRVFIRAWALMSAAAAWADTETVDGIQWPYTVENGEATIGGEGWYGWHGLDAPVGDVVIPSALGGCPVTAIGDFAFQDCSEVTSITIPESVRSIGRQAFSGCELITELNIPFGVTNIKLHAFSSCRNLKRVMMPEGVQSIGELAFSWCRSLDDVTIPASVTSIGSGLFMFCEGLTSLALAEGNSNYVLENGLLMTKDRKTIVQGFKDAVSVPDGVTSIGDMAFAGSCRLTSLTIPNSVTNVGELAFIANVDLESVTVPLSVTCFGEAVFAGCSNLTSFVVADDNPNYKSSDGCLLSKDGKTLHFAAAVHGEAVIPDGVTVIGTSAFYESSGLTSVTMPDSVTDVEDYAFEFCGNLKSVKFGNGVEKIGDNAFHVCRSLTDVTIPSSVASIGTRAFASCDSLETIRIPLSLAAQIEANDVFGWGRPEIIYYTGDTEIGFDTDITALREKEACTYDGYLYDGDTVIGTVQVKRPKRRKGDYQKDGTSVVIQIPGEKKRTVKSKDMWVGLYSDSEFTGTTKDGLRVDLEFDVWGMTGDIRGFRVYGVRNLFTAKDTEMKGFAANRLAPWIGTLNMICDGGTLSVTLAKKGKVTVKGEMDGVKVSAKSQALICETDIRIPVIYSKKGLNLAFVIRLPYDGGKPQVVGLDGALIGKAGTLADGAKFGLEIDKASVAADIPGVLPEYLPDGENVSASGKKWVVADGVKAAKVKYDRKTGAVTVVSGKKGGEVANASGLKLTYTAKKGTFKGSFKVYSVVDGKLKTFTFKVSGVVIDGVGYGEATCKKLGVSWNVAVE